MVIRSLFRCLPLWPVVAMTVLHAGGPMEASAFAPRSLPLGATRFTTLPSGDTGLATLNNYDDPAMWSTRYQELIYGAMGTGVAVGDYDGDGRPDVLVVSKTESSRLYRNLGGWKFEDVTARAGISEPGKPGGWTQGAAFADVNNDGRLDLYLCRFGMPNELFINQGDGTFREEAAARGLAVVDACGMAAFCDYDRDGWLDMYLVTSLGDAVKAPNGQRDYLFHNRGDGTFENVTTAAGIAGEAMGHTATWWDYDADGWPDLYVDNDYASPDALYHNNGNGSFRNVIDEVVPRTPYYAMGADLGDVDNDGRLDLFVADMAASTREKDQRGMAGSRGRAQTYADDPASAPPLMHNALYLATGKGRVREAALQAGIAATDWTWSPRFEDFDCDGRVDLHVTNGMIREYHNADLLERIMGLDDPSDARRTMRAAPVLAEQNLLYRNEGELRFKEVGAEWGMAEVGVSFGMATGDFDGDGDLDVIYGNYQKGPTVLRNDTQEGHRLVIALRGTRSNRFGVGATVRITSASGPQVRTLVLARGYLSTSEPILHFGLGADTLVRELSVEWPSGEVQRFRDLAVDQKLTITEPASGAKPIALPEPRSLFAASALELVAHEAPENDANPQPLLPFRFDRRGPALAVWPRAEHEELLFGGTTKDPLAGFAADGLDDGSLLVFEANGDGQPDLLQTKGGTSRPFGPDYQPRLHLGGASGFTSAALPPFPLSCGAAIAADIDRDGDLDVFLGARVLPGKYPLSPRSVLWRNDGGTFTAIPLPNGGEVGMVTSAVFSDLDQDGWPDLVLTTDWGTVVYLHNEAGRGFSDRSVAAGFTQSGMWTSIAAADFNQDGRPDYAVGNQGLNTPYREGPAILFQGRFGDGGPPLLVEAIEENGQLYPRRSRNELGARISGLLRRFPKHNDYAKATLAEVVGAGKLAKAKRFTADELRSGVYLSQADGTYRFAALPWAAQLAPLQGMVAVDLSGDGVPDLAAGQNSHAPTPSLGRFAGGLGVVLINDGHGQFTALDPQASGLIVPGDAKALVVTDRNGDGWPDLVASCNDAPALQFLHRGLPGMRPLRVRLQGRIGNPTAIGAQVTLTLADGATRSAEVMAGSGYASQSSPDVFFALPAAIRSLSVRWPDGARTEHTVAADVTDVTIAQPR